MISGISIRKDDMNNKTNYISSWVQELPDLQVVCFFQEASG